ncbi:hypothetical protein OAO87_04430 [bacterium]|nr:hypothetical protein [bacterium]
MGAIAARAARDGVDDVLLRSEAAATWPACSPADLVHWRHREQIFRIVQPII